MAQADYSQTSDRSAALRGSTPSPLLVGDRPLPHNEDAEIAVLGSMLLDPENAIDAAVARLNFPGSFFHPGHQTIFDTLVELCADRRKSGIDLLSLSDALDRRGRLEEIGGASYLARILNSVPSAANVDKYVDIVYDDAVLRRIIASGADIVGQCFDRERSVKELLDAFEEEILGISELHAASAAVPVGEVILKAIDLLDKLRQKDPSVMGLSSGFPDLDALITGFRPGEMIVLAARPSIGKTALALNVACNIAMNDNPTAVGIFSLEMGTELLVLRLLCTLARVSLGDIRDGAISQARWQGITQQGERLKKAPIYIDDAGTLDIDDLRHRARQMWRKHDVRMIIVDYLQLVRPVSSNRNSTRENEVSQISARLKALAKELNIPVLVLAQLNRQASQPGQRPRLSHLRESGAIEQDADIVALLHRDRDVETDQGVHIDEGMDAELIIAKNRNGPTGLVPLTFIPAWTRFESRARVHNSDVPDPGM